MDKFFKKVLFALLGVFLAFGVAGTPAQAAEPTVDVKISNIIYSAEKGGDVATAYQLVRYKGSGNDYEFADSEFEAYVKAQATSGQTAIAYLSSLDNSGVASLMTSYLRNVGALDRLRQPRDRRERQHRHAAGPRAGLLPHSRHE